MKSLSFPMILLAFLVILSCSSISAFTSFLSSIFKVNDSQTEQASQSSLAAAAHKTLRKRQNTTTPSFDAHAQYIDVSGAHAFVPPNFAAGDLRGPCPALNALANHGYLPHNGFATVDQLVTATNVVFGMVCFPHIIAWSSERRSHTDRNRALTSPRYSQSTASSWMATLFLSIRDCL